MTIQLQGAGSTTLLNELLKSNIVIHNVQIISPKCIQFEINISMYQNLLLLSKEKCYNIIVLKDNIFVRLKNLVLKRAGVCIGLVLVVVFNIIFSRFTFSYQILGLETISTQSVEDALSKYGIKKGKINNFDNNDLEIYLRKAIPEISLVSVMKKGNVLVVNIKEKLPEIDTTHYALTAPHTMLITKIDVVNGTALKKVGDIATKGEELVAPYTYDQEGTKVDCEPIAVVSGKVWFVGSVQFEEDKIEYRRTGKKIKNVRYYLGNKNIYSSVKNVSYEYFDKETKHVKAFNNLFVPLNITYDYYFETKAVNVHTDYASVEQSLIDESKSKAYSSIPNGYVVNNEKVVVSNSNGKYVITTYLESDIEVK